MLGRLYDKIDAAIGQPIDDGEVFGVEEASSMILAEILDRADTLYALFVFGSADQMNENEIARAVLVFHRDCQEARERAERLGLMFEPGSYTESMGERSFLVPGETVEVHPWIKARWQERRERQVAHLEREEQKPTLKTEGESSPEEADA